MNLFGKEEKRIQMPEIQYRCRPCEVGETAKVGTPDCWNCGAPMEPGRPSALIKLASALPAYLRNQWHQND